MDLSSGLKRVFKKIRGASLLDEDLINSVLKDLQRTLILNDVDIILVKKLTDNIKKRASTEEIKKIGGKELLTKIIYEELSKLIGEEHKPRMTKHKILLLGLFGSGKTTTAGKLAYFYKKNGFKTGLIQLDVYRPAAYEQLHQLAEKIGVDFFGIKGEKNPIKILKKGLEVFKDKDIIIVDTAGRNALDEEMIKEIKDINEILKPEEKYLVLSADIGKIAKKQAEEFNKAVGITGVIITKLDGSGKGGAALSAIHELNIKVPFIGIGEDIKDFEIFDPKRYIGDLIGIPNLERLLERIKEIEMEEEIDLKDLKNLNFLVFQKQLRMMKKLGSFSKILKMFGLGDLPKDLMLKSEEKMRKYDAIINSMTKDERLNPNLVKNPSRIRRIAKGSGTTEKDVKELIKELERIKKIYKKFDERKIEKLMKRFGGKGFP